MASVVALTLAPAASGAADHTWSGAGAAQIQPGAGTWSDAANWSAGGTPTSGETIGTLTFPALTDPACDSMSPTPACGRGTNDLTGLTVGTLAINDAHVDSRGGAYALRGNGIALTGGLTASPGAVKSRGRFENAVALPITLAAPQTWSVTGSAPPSLAYPVRLSDGISMLAPINGSAQSLTIRFSGGVGLSLSGDNEVGPVSVMGAAVGQPPFEHKLAVRKGELNATDGNPVSITNAEFDASGQFGPLTLTNSALVIGEMSKPAGTVTTPAVRLDRRSASLFTIPSSGSVAGVDYSQLRSTGPIALGGAHLFVATGSDTGSRCPRRRIGAVYTLVSTTGTLTGTFDVPEDGVYRFTYLGSPCKANRFALRIEYHKSGSPQTVTGTAVPTPPLGIAPGVAGAASVRGRVFLRRRGQAKFTRIGAGELIRAGSELDTTRGRVRLTVATNRQGGTADATLYGGRFVFRQTGKARLRTRFRLSQPLDGCARARGRTATASRRRHRHRRRHVWVNENGGDFDTRGQFVGTSVQGTTWLTGDTCTTSFVKVKRGTVTVHDLVRHRRVMLHGAQSYTVRKRR